MREPGRFGEGKVRLWPGQLDKHSHFEATALFSVTQTGRATIDVASYCLNPQKAAEGISLCQAPRPLYEKFASSGKYNLCDGDTSRSTPRGNNWIRRTDELGTVSALNALESMILTANFLKITKSEYQTYV